MFVSFSDAITFYRVPEDLLILGQNLVVVVVLVDHQQFCSTSHFLSSY